LRLIERNSSNVANEQYYQHLLPHDEHGVAKKLIGASNVAEIPRVQLTSDTEQQQANNKVIVHTHDLHGNSSKMNNFNNTSRNNIGNNVAFDVENNDTIINNDGQESSSFFFNNSEKPCCEWAQPLETKHITIQKVFFLLNYFI
jgi:hypothetical protein